MLVRGFLGTRTTGLGSDRAPHRGTIAARLTALIAPAVALAGSGCGSRPAPSGDLSRLGDLEGDTLRREIRLVVEQ